jgi:thioredoxin-related protein
MKKSVILVLLFLPLLLLGELKKEGKFIGAKEVHLPNYTYESFLDFPEDVDNLKNENKRLILLVHQKNCPYCARFSEKVLKKENIKNKILEHFGMVEFNMFGDREVVGFDGEDYTEKEYAKKLGLQFTPAILFYDENSSKILQLNGFIKEKKFNDALEYILNKKEKQLSFTQYLQEKEAKKNNIKIVKSDIFNTSLKSMSRTKSSKELAIFFESSQCEDCSIFHERYITDPFIKKQIRKIDVAQIDTAHNKVMVRPNRLISYTNDFIEDLKIDNIPTIVFFDNKGKEIIRIDSFYKMFHMQSIFDYVVSGAYKNEKEFQRYLTARSQAIREQGVDVDIWK